MATGTLSAPAISASGTAATFTVTGGTWGGTLALASATAIAFSVTSDGFSAGAAATPSRTVYAVGAPTYGGGTITVKLGEPIHDGDTSITVTAAADAIGDGTDTTASLGSTAVTNNSTLAYAVPVCNIISEVFERVVTTHNVDIYACGGAYAGHRSNLGIDRVEVTITEPLTTGGSPGTFTVGETITGGTSGATAVLQKQVTTVLYLTDVSGPFTAAETLTGGTSGATATYSSGGRAVTKTSNTLTRVDRIGSYGWQTQISNVFRTTFNFASGGDWSGGCANKKWVLVKAIAKPKIGDTAGGCGLEYVYSNPANDYDVDDAYVDPTGTMALSVGLSANVVIGERLVGGTSSAVAVVNQAYSAGATSLSVSYVTGTFTAGEALTFDSGATATLSGSPTWTADDTTGAVGSTLTPYRTLQRAGSALTSASSDGTSSWSRLLLKAGRNFLGTYNASFIVRTTHGPVIITRAAGVAEDDAVISGSCTSDGIRTSLIRFQDVKIDFKYSDESTSTAMYRLDTGSASGATGAYIPPWSTATWNFLIFKNVVLEGAGTSFGLGTATNYFMEQTFERTYRYGGHCSGMLNPLAYRCKVTRDYIVEDCGSDFVRAEASVVEGSFTGNNDLSLSGVGGIHADVWQFPGSTGVVKATYANNTFHQNWSHDMINCQIAPFYNGNIDNLDEAIRTAMTFNVQEGDTTAQSSQLDDCYLESWFFYGNVHNDKILFRNDFSEANAWYVGNMIAEAGLHTNAPLAGKAHNHFIINSGSDFGQDYTEGSDTDTLFDGWDAQNYHPAGSLLNRIDEPVATWDAAGTAWSASGNPIGALVAVVTLTAPADNATDQPTTTTFSWETFSGADHYHLFYTPDGGAEVEVADIAGTSHQVSGLDPNTEYTWYVLAHAADDEIVALATSETWTFTTGAGSDKRSRTSMSIGIGIGL